MVSATVVLVASGIFIFAACQSQPRKHQNDVIVNLHQPLPQDIRDRMIPPWFDSSFFPSPDDTLELNRQEWKERLSGSEFHIQRSEGTERPFFNEYHATETEGIYVCRGCSSPLFSSVTKFKSRSGWPSFFAPVSLAHIGVKQDKRLLMERTEVHCARCGGHLGHVFDDGPRPTGLRYCINSSSLRLIDEESHRKIAEGREDELDFRLNR